MINSKKRKFLSTLAILAVAATATLGGLSLVSGNPVPDVIANADSTIVNKTSEEEATKYYVGTPEEGAAQTGTSEDDPMSPDLFQSKLVDLKPGDIVYILPGIHVANSTWAIGRMSDSETTGKYVNGSYDDYIVFNALDPTKDTGLSFYNQSFGSTNRGVHIYGDYYYWSGIDVCGAGDNGLYIGGNYNVVEDCEFYDNRDTGLQLGRNYSSNGTINTWPNYNLVRNCTSHNNYDNETKGENADGFAAKLTVGYHNVFDGCIAYRNSDDGWDLYGKDDTGIIGTVYMYNCVAFENGFLEYTQKECNDKYPNVLESALETNQNTYMTANGDGNGFKLGGSTLEGDVFVYNCYAFNNRMHGITDNSNPGVISLTNVTSYNNSAIIDNTPGSETFGQVTGCDTEHNNIDMARSESSYNNFTGVLSVFNGRSGSGNDAYLGSAENSLLVAGNKWNKIEDAYDANSITGRNGQSVDSVAAENIFAALPANNLGVDRELDIHTAWRNADGSINMGDILKIKDYSVLGFAEGEIGANLSLTSQDGYTLPDYTFLTGEESETEAKAQAIYDMIYLPVKQNAVYQDFDLATAMVGSVNVTWSSSNEGVISISDKITTSISGVRQVTAVVNRDAEKDAEVTLTASFTVGGQNYKKEFNVVVKCNEFIVGDIIVDGVNLNDNTYIVSQYSLAKEPGVTVLNAADYNGKVLPEDAYELKTTYMYTPVKGGHMVEVADFTASNAGVYEITKQVSCNGTSNEYTYTLYVVYNGATVDFMQAPSVNVTYGGFTIIGELNNVSGTLYAMVADEQPTIEQMKAEGQKFDIVKDNITAQFEADNSGAYTIYYAVCNPYGDLTSQIYSTEVTVSEISTVEELQSVVAGDSQTNVIYALTNDIDLSEINNWNNGSSEGFVGYLDGRNHTISNFSISASSSGEASFIQRISGGTIININFDEFDIQSTANQVGIIGQAYSGNLINIKMTNIDVHSSGQRVGGLIGQAFEANGTLPLIIDRVSLVNDDEHAITSADRRAAGILGFVQVNTSPDSATVDIRISNCYVDSLIGDRNAVEGSATYSGEQFGGIVGTYDGSSSGAALIENFSMSIDRCYFTGTVAGQNRVAGIIGYQQGLTKLTVTRCINTGDIYYIDGTAPIIAAEKNASGIFGGYVANAPTSVATCYAKFEEHNATYFVSIYSENNLVTEDFWSLMLGFDLENIWQFNAEQAPYVTLR